MKMYPYIEWVRFRLWKLVPWLFSKEFRIYNSFFNKFIKEGDICFDIGAHSGAVARHFLYLGCRVIAIEPIPKFACGLKNRFRFFPITVIEKAVSNEIGIRELFLSDKAQLSTLSSSFKAEYNEYYSDKSIEVEVTTLDELIDTYGQPTFCKIDVEGYEKEVLLGLRKKIEWISIEYHKSLIHLTIECLQNLSNSQSVLFNYSTNEREGFNLKKWTGNSNLLMNEMLNENGNGNIYVRSSKN